MSLMKTIAMTLVLTAAVFTGTSFATPAKGEKKGILIASFGTSMPEAKKAIDNLVEAAKKAFPETEVRVAYTSNIIRRKIAREQKVFIPTPLEALARMNDEGFSHVCVMPMHIIPGAEYDEIRSVAEAMASIKGKYGFKEVRVGQPFLSSVPACDRMAEILVKRFEKQLADKDTAVVLMGHGTPHHIANALYSQLQLSLNKAAEGRFFLGTVEAAPLIEDVIGALKKSPYRKLVISPLMIVAGDHANNDLADKEDPESWYSLLKAAGYSDITPYLVGLGEDPEMAKTFVDHLKEAMK